MRPVLFEIFGVKVYSHPFFLVLGILVLLAWVAYEARRRRWPASEVVPIGLGGSAGAMVGARLSILFFNGLSTAPVVLNFYSLFDPRVGPGSILGAIAGAYIGGYVVSRVIGKAGCACDAFAPGMALGMAVGRIGDFLSGEDGLGKPTTLPWGVHPVAGSDFLVHPAPLYDSGFNLIWFVVLVALRDNPHFQDGRLLKFGVAGYAVGRFFIEFLRNNQVIALGLTGQQFFSLGLLCARGRLLRSRPAAQAGCPNCLRSRHQVFHPSPLRPRLTGGRAPAAMTSTPSSTSGMAATGGPRTDRNGGTGHGGRGKIRRSPRWPYPSRRAPAARSGGPATGATSGLASSASSWAISCWPSSST